MISLSAAKKLEPYTVEIGFGLKMTLKPMTLTSMSICHAAARAKLTKVFRDCEDSVALGLVPQFDMDDPSTREGLMEALVIQEIGQRHITAWEGIADNPPVNAENIRAILELDPVGILFKNRILEESIALGAAKNESGPSPDGTINEEGDSNIVVDAESKDCLVRKETEAASTM